MKIVFTGGGTAGHIFPIIAIVREIKKSYKGGDLDFFYIGPKDEFAQNLLLREGIRIKFVLSGKIRRYFSPTSFLKNIFDIFFKIPIGFLQSFFWIFILSPDLIFSKGGYGSLPVSFAGWLLLVPIILHESDAEPGLANKIISRLSIEIFVSFPVENTNYFPSNKMVYVGNPIRSELLMGDKEKAKELFNLKFDKPVLLVIGGSQGSERINDIILTILPKLLKNFEVIHQTGIKNIERVKNESRAVLYTKEDSILLEYYHPVGFLDEEMLKHAYKAADLIISRSGSGSIFEISSLGKPSILIPLPESAQNHQVKNAYVYSKFGACIVVEENNLKPNFFLEEIRLLLARKEKIQSMSIAARLFSKELSARIIAEYIIEYLNK
jgi:UDP-N-acetylglucosamine--N-acetylmuramyl-(pentapeptide) pyrophosphoryl-undecaprenol N-acetylglucosamine transferase